MQSSNPVFTRNAEFNGQARSHSGFGQTQTSGYSDPSTWSTGSPNDPYTPAATTSAGGRMTIESVVHKTAITLGIVVVAAAITWMLTGQVIDGATVNTSTLSQLSGLAVGGAIVGFILAMVNSFKKVISPALVIAYAVVEGVFVGALSKLIEAQFGGGLAFQAMIGTMAAFAATLFVYRTFNIRVTDKFRRGFTMVLMGVVLVMVANFVVGMFNGNGFGLRGFDTLGLIVSIGMVVLGVIALVLDFDFVERGIEAGLPERESWRAAFGLTVTLVWLYIEILRILAILRGD